MLFLLKNFFSYLYEEGRVSLAVITNSGATVLKFAISKAEFGTTFITEPVPEHTVATKRSNTG